MNVNQIIDALTKFRDQNPENGLATVFSECSSTGMSWKTDRVIEVVHKGETAIIIGIDGPVGPMTPDEREFIQTQLIISLIVQYVVVQHTTLKKEMKKGSSHKRTS